MNIDDPSKLPHYRNIDIRYEHILQVFQISASMSHCAFGKFEKNKLISYYLHLLRSVNKYLYITTFPHNLIYHFMSF